MEYEGLRKIFHISESEAAQEHQRRLAAKNTKELGLSIKDNECFYCMDAEVYELIIKCERLDKRIREEIALLPPIALHQYITSTLIEEIVLTNEIEGVRSSRREIGDVLANLEKNDKRRRFHGIVEKYNALVGSSDIAIETCQDIRDIYDELVREEVESQKPDSRLDGEYFRAGPVSVLNEADIPIHQGIEPESKIIRYLEEALRILNDEATELLVRISLFHFLFAYIHPFYDGNGRTNRFISSYMMASRFSPLVGLKLSHAVKQHIKAYYKAFTICEHPLNKGDLTPFIILFSEIIVSAMEDIATTLKEKRAAMDDAERAMLLLSGIHDQKDLPRIGGILIQAALFSDIGITMQELKDTTGLSEPTINKRLAYFEELGLSMKTKQGRRVHHQMDLGALKGLK